MRRARLRLGACCALWRTLAALAGIAAVGTATLWRQQMAPMLAALPSRADALAQLAAAARALPDGRVVVAPNGSVAISRPLPQFIKCDVKVC